MTKIILTVILGVLPSLVWLCLFLKNDENPEPRILILLTFLIGILIVFPTFLIEKYLNVSSLFSNIAKGSLLVLFLTALTEEILKFSAAYITTKNNPEFDEPVDAMVYSITAALGFATLENLSIIYGMFGNYSSPVIAMTALFRFTGAIFLHALCGGIIGFFWAKGLTFKRVILFTGMGIALAAVFHFAFNYTILYVSSGIFFSSLVLIFSSFAILLFFKNLRKYGRITEIKNNF